MVEDEPYFVELQLLARRGSSDRGLRRRRHLPDHRHRLPSDTSLQADGRTRVLGYSREVGRGGVVYVALGHCHNPAIRTARAVNPTDTTPPTFRGSWESDAFLRCCATPSRGVWETEANEG